MMNCSKVYSEIPFAHRQYLHPGHCSRIHGHNWTIKLTFSCDSFDTCGFVVDFGKLKYIKAWIDEHLDHACVIAIEDPSREIIRKLEPNLIKAYEVQNSSCEGLSQHLWEIFSALLCKYEGSRAWISQFELFEDSRNATCYVPPIADITRVRFSQSSPTAVTTATTKSQPREATV